MTDVSIAQVSQACSRRPASQTLFARLRAYLLEAQARRILLRLPDHLLRDAGLTRSDGWTLANRESWDAATRLEIEHLRRRLF